MSACAVGRTGAARMPIDRRRAEKVPAPARRPPRRGPLRDGDPYAPRLTASMASIFFTASSIFARAREWVSSSIEAVLKA